MKAHQKAARELFFLFIFLGLYMCPRAYPETKNPKTSLLYITGSFLVYSYDSNLIFGENVSFQMGGYNISGLILKIDVSSLTFLVQGKVEISAENEAIECDEFFFDPSKTSGTAVTYGPKIILRFIGPAGQEPLALSQGPGTEITLESIKKSLLYFTCPKMEITADYQVYGEQAVLYIEGFRSLSFKRFKLSEGFKLEERGFSIDKLWYTNSQGIVGNVRHQYSGSHIISSSRLHYEERSILKNNQGPSRQADFLSSAEIDLNPGLKMNISGNYSSSSLWNSEFGLSKKWNQHFLTDLNISYNKPIQTAGETWIGVGSHIRSSRLGSLSLTAKYEIHDQFLGSFSYGKNFFDRFDFTMSSTYSKVKARGGSADFSEIASGNLSLNFNSKLFNFATNYYLNYDLIGSQVLSQPNIQISLKPWRFYGGLLKADLRNVFYYNYLHRPQSGRSTYNNNTILTLGTSPLEIKKNLQIYFELATEQFIEKEGRNFTSTGLILNIKKSFSSGISLESHYSIQSRRKTKNWLIEGTTGQDLSMMVKLNPSAHVTGWTSFSYDPKNGRWRQSFTDLSLYLFENWKIHSLLTYDFLLNKVNNIDLFLIREAGRFQLRFIWRSISKQFLVELIPR